MATRRSTRRKRGAQSSEEANGDEGSKVAAPVTSVVWEWENDKSVWTKYKTEHSDELTKALTRGDNNVSLQVTPTVKMNVRFSTMTQMNSSTGWQRNVRCSSSKSDGCGKWEWQDENEKWNEYSPTIQCLLSACVLCGVDERVLESGGREYRVDLAGKKQVNVETAVERKIRHSTTDTESSAASPPSPPTSSGHSKPKRGRKSVKQEASSSGEASSSTKTDDSSGRVVLATKGSVPIDFACSQMVGKARVYCEGKEVWDAMLNQTNLKNNNNKFYILQLLQDNGPRANYSVWFRWGRVGKTGQSSLQSCGADLEQAKDLFMKKFSDKTKNSWEDRQSFVKVPGKYDLLLMDYEAKDEADGDVDSVDGVDGGGVEDEGGEDKKPVESKLDVRLQSLIQLICYVQAMEDMVVEMKYDAKKAPLGKLTTDQIRSGYSALKKIEDCINKSDFGDRLYRACDEFYTRIPHCFGMQRPPVIRTREQVKEKIALLEALGDIQIALKVLSSGGKGQHEVHPLDHHYHELKCQLSLIDPEESIFSLVEKYMRQTHAKTHSQYTLELTDLFEVEREGEKESFMDVGNRKLLWHGSRLTNWVGILSQGLRIAPPEAPVTGYMFGKGVYFADMSSKSANYCFASKSKKEALLLLCDVSLGHTNDLLAADYSADQLPKGKHSVVGLGRVAPNPAMEVKLPGGCVIPMGTSVDTGVNNPRGYTLNYNEFIVYDTKQVRMKYLAKVKFNFK